MEIDCLLSMKFKSMLGITNGNSLNKHPGFIDPSFNSKSSINL